MSNDAGAVDIGPCPHVSLIKDLLMTYFPLSDEFHSMPELLGASDAAVALYARAASWSACHLTDGHVPSSALPLLTASHEQGSAELLERRVWRRARGGFQFVVWPKQATRANVKASREANRGRQEKRRRSQGAVSRRDSRVSHGVTHDVTHGVSHSPHATPRHTSSSDEELPPHVPPNDDRFGEFWETYPRKDNKQAARKAWAKALKQHDADELISQAQRWAGLWRSAGVEKRFIPHAATWLNNERWTDEPPSERLRAVSGGHQPFQNPTDPAAAYGGDW